MRPLPANFFTGMPTSWERLTRSPELTEEIVQDVFLKIWLNREALAEVSHFKVYLLLSPVTKSPCLLSRSFSTEGGSSGKMYGWWSRDGNLHKQEQ